MHPAPSLIEFAHPTEDRFHVWVDRADPGDIIEYHRGFLAIDRGEDRDEKDPGRRHIRRLARFALEAFAGGRVCLVQRRLAPGVYSYLAIARQ